MRPLIKSMSNELDTVFLVLVSQLLRQFVTSTIDSGITKTWTVRVRHEIDVWESSFYGQVLVHHIETT